MASAKSDDFSDSASNMELLEKAKSEFNREKRLVIKNLPFNTTEKEIQAFMGFNGEFPVEEITMVKYFNQAVVALKDPALVSEAISKLDNTKLDNLVVSVSVYRSDKMLCIGHLPTDMTEYKFREMVSEFGNIEKCFLMRSEKNGESKGYGIVEYNEPIEKVGQIKCKLDWHEVSGHTLHCDAITDSAQSGLTFSDLHSKCLLVDSLPDDFKDPIELREIVSKVVKPIFCQILTKEGESLGFGVLEFDNAEEAEKAYLELNGHKINNTAMRLSYCIPGKSAIHMSSRIVFKYGTRVPVNKSSLLPDPVYPNPAFLKHNFFKTHVSKNPRMLVQFTDSLVQLSEGYVKTLEDKTNAKPGLLGPAPTIPMSPLMDVNLQLGLLSLIVLDAREKGTYNGEVPDPLGKLKIPTEEEIQQKQKPEPVSLLGDPVTAQANIILKNLLLPPDAADVRVPVKADDDAPELLGRSIHSLNLVYLCSLGRLMAMLSDHTQSMGILGQGPAEMPPQQSGGQKPLMESLNQVAQSLLSSMGSKPNSQLPNPQGLLGNAPSMNTGNGNGGQNASNFMTAIQAMAMQKMNENKGSMGGGGAAGGGGSSGPRTLESLFANKSKQPGGGLLGNFPGPPQGQGQGHSPRGLISPNNNSPQGGSLLGKPPPSMFGKGDGLLPSPPLPSPKEGPGNYGNYGNQGNQGNQGGGGYDDSGYQGGYDEYNSAYNDGYNDYNMKNEHYGNQGNQGNQRNQGWTGNNQRDTPVEGGMKRKMNDRGSEEKDYNNIAQQAAAYAAGAAAAYKQQYDEYMSRSGYGNYGNDYQGYDGSGYGSGNRDYGSGYRGNNYEDSGNDNYGNYGSGNGNYGSSGNYNSSNNNSYSSSSGYGNNGSYGGSYDSSGSYGSSGNFGSSSSYGSSGNFSAAGGNSSGSYSTAGGNSSGNYSSFGGNNTGSFSSTGGSTGSGLLGSGKTYGSYESSSKSLLGSGNFSRSSSNYGESSSGPQRFSTSTFGKGVGTGTGSYGAGSDNGYRASSLNAAGPIRDVRPTLPRVPALGAGQGKSALMGPPLPPAPSQGIIGTPQGQKRGSSHILPSPEPSPEGDYIGQHSQGIGGHYADTYTKRQKLTGKF